MTGPNPATPQPASGGPLLPGETLLWSGQPLQGLVFGSAEKFLLPFSLLWGGFAFFWNATVWAMGAPLLFKLFGLPFLVVGIYMIFGRFIVDSRRRARTHYAVTDQRVLISEGNGANIRSFPIEALPALEMVETAGGQGSILFGQQSMTAQMGMQARGWPGVATPAEFFRIENVRQVYELIRKTAEARRKKS